MAPQTKDGIKLLQKNKKAYFNYEVLEELECGISLTGTEVKSIRASKFSFGDSYVKITNAGLLLMALTIQQYSHGNIHNHQPERSRQLLAHKQEIKRLKRKVEEKGYTLVPTKIYLKANKIKVEIALCRGKKLHDKRDVIRERDLHKAAGREMREALKS